jgi:hypothetical protein
VLAASVEHHLILALHDGRRRGGHSPYAALGQRMSARMERDTRVRSPRQRESQTDERARMQSGEVEVHWGLGERDYAYACERGGLGMSFTRSLAYGDDGARGGQAGMVVITEVSCDGPANRAGGAKLQCVANCLPRCCCLL